MSTRTAKINPGQNGRADHQATPFGLDSRRMRDADEMHPPSRPGHAKVAIRPCASEMES